jgi:hypothetical protein
MGVTRRIAQKSICQSQNHLLEAEKYRPETHHPDRREQQADLHAGELGVDGRDDDVPVQLGANADADNPKVHQYQGPQPPVDQHVPQIPQVPRPRMIDPPQVMVMHDGILPLQRLGARGQPP